MYEYSGRSLRAFNAVLLSNPNLIRYMQLEFTKHICTAAELL